MALKVEVDAQQAKSVEVRSGNKNGRDWTMRSQPIWVYKPDQKFPVEINMVLPDEVEVYPAGNYTLDLERAFDQGNFKSIILNSRLLVLRPAKA